LDALPYGLSAEAMTVGALRQAHENAISDYEREHVTPWIRENLRANIIDGNMLVGHQDLSHLRFTVDNFDDYLHVNKVFKSVDAEPVNVSWKSLIDGVRNMPSVPQFNIPYRINRGKIESVIALGTAQLGLEYGVSNKAGMPEPKETMSLIHSAIEHGVNWIDTARAYGSSEQRVGEALSAGWHSRTRVVTKLDPLTHLPDDASVSCIEASVHRSLLTSQNALGMKCLDVVLLHRCEHHSSHQGYIWKILKQQKEQGLINELGASIYKPAEAIEVLADKDVTHLQIPFNLFDHRWLDNSFQNALANRPDVRIHVRSVFLQGLLVSDAEIWPDWDAAASDRVKQINELVKLLGRQNRAELCIAFVLAQDWVDAIVMGVETNEQLQANLRLACEKPLTLDECNTIVENLFDIPERLINPSLW
jgi:spore coat polysaccharide biosynthesis protein SpsF